MKQQLAIQLGRPVQKLERKQYAGKPTTQRQLVVLYCFECGKEVKMYPGEEMRPEEIQERMSNFICRGCENGQQPSYLHESHPYQPDTICENCGANHATELCDA